MPDAVGDRLAVLVGMRDFLTANPGREVSNPELALTAAQAGALATALTDARTALNGKVAARVTGKAAREFAVGELRNAMSGLTGELGHILPDGSGEWYYFGLVPPGASQRPGVPDGVSAHQVGPTTAAAGWPASPRGEKYRPFKKVEGVDADFVALDLTSETQVLLENVPPHATVHFCVTAYNSAGESARSAEVTLTLA